MAFSREVREAALIAAARHCCVCRRYKGVKVEVHHILPAGDGGTDDFENAIALCFDCHADAGHYNPQHPRGTKYSPSELRRARYEWHDLVTKNEVERAPANTGVWARYLIARDWSVVCEVLNGDFSRFPATKPVLARSPALSFVRELAKRIDGDRRTTVQSGTWETEGEYLSAHPDADEIAREELPYPYFSYSRSVEADEIRSTVAVSDPVTEALLDRDVPPHEIAYAFSFWERCGPDRVVEEIRLRPAWVMFLAVENVSDGPMSVEAVEGVESVEMLYLPFNDGPSQDAQLPLPAADLAPGMTAIVCTGVLLGPFSGGDTEYHRREATDLPSGQSQQLAHVSFHTEGDGGFHTIGPRFDVAALRLAGGAIIEIHELDIRNTYVIDRYWEMGSCPHLFFRTDDGDWCYWGEVVPDGQDQVVTTEIVAPLDANRAVLAELEHEITTVARIDVQGRAILENHMMLEGEVYEFPVSGGAKIRITGSYSVQGWAVGAGEAWKRNQLVRGFLQAKRKGVDSNAG